MPDSLGHIFVRWLHVKREVGQDAAWHYFNIANTALARCLRPHERNCTSEVGREAPPHGGLLVGAGWLAD